MNTSPAYIKKILDEYDKRNVSSHLKRCLLSTYSTLGEANKYLEIPYLNKFTDTDISGIYLLTQDTLYFIDGSIGSLRNPIKIIEGSHNLTLFKQNRGVINGNWRFLSFDEVKDIKKRTGHTVPSEHHMIVKLRMFYQNLVDPSEKELTREELYQFFCITLIDVSINSRVMLDLSFNFLREVTRLDIYRIKGITVLRELNSDQLLSWEVFQAMMDYPNWKEIKKSISLLRKNSLLNVHTLNAISITTKDFKSNIALINECEKFLNHSILNKIIDYKHKNTLRNVLYYTSCENTETFAKLTLHPDIKALEEVLNLYFTSHIGFVDSPSPRKNYVELAINYNRFSSLMKITESLKKRGICVATHIDLIMRHENHDALIVAIDKSDDALIHCYLELFIQYKNPVPLLDLLISIKKVNPDLYFPSYFLNEASINELIHIVAILSKTNLLDQTLFNTIINLFTFSFDKSKELINNLFHDKLIDYFLSSLMSVDPPFYHVLYDRLKHHYLDDAFIPWFSEMKTKVTNISDIFFYLQDHPSPYTHLLMQKLIKAIDTFQENIQLSIIYAAIHAGDKENIDLVFDQVSKLSDRTLIALLNEALSGYYPQLFNEIKSRYATLVSINLFDRGNSVDNWWQLAMTLIDRAPALKIKPGTDFFSLKVNKAPLPNKKDLSYYRDKFKTEDWRFLRLQGRTILLEAPNKDIFAIKLAKKDESPSEHYREFTVTDLLKYLPGLKSKLVEVIDYTSLTSGEIIQLVPYPFEELINTKFSELIQFQKNALYACYLYFVSKENRGIFKYLHNTSISNNVYADSNEICIHDLCLLLANKIVYTQSTDLYHNQHLNPSVRGNPEREDVGRYIVLANLLAPTQLRRERRAGTGRLNDWLGAVEFPNFRKRKITDWGDGETLNALMYNGEWAKKYFHSATELYKEKIGNYLIANYLAEKQYDFFLIAGRRGRELTSTIKSVLDKTPDELKQMISEIWLILAKQIINNCVSMLDFLTHQPKFELQKNLEKIVDVKRLARQMQFWMTDEYISYLSQSTIPTDIYGNDVATTVVASGFRAGTFHPDVGLSINGKDPDLGPVNGPEPIKEANKLFYWMIIILFSAYHEYKIMRGDIRKVMQEPELEKADLLRRNSFFYLPKKRYHLLQASLCNYQSNRTESVDKKNQYSNEINEHKKTYAALMIQTIWRNKNNKILSSSDDDSHRDTNNIKIKNQK